MKMVITTKVDSDVKNAVCQYLSQYDARLRKLYMLFRPYVDSIDRHEYVEVDRPLYEHVRDLCDNLNDSITGVNRALENPDLPPRTDQKRMIFTWYDVVRSWAHDSRAFIQNIYPIVRDDNNRYVNTDDMHSLIALQSALRAMERSVFAAMTESVDAEFMICEIFKVFDKFKRCYRENDKAFEKDTGSVFYKHVRCVKGFESVPLNLYTNAFKYLPQDKPKENCIRVTFKEDVSGVFISVSSVGPFVPAKDIPTLWNPGVRAESAILATDEGFGLGLPRVRKLCVLSGFDVSITSEHREIDNAGWGLFTATIHIPRTSYCDA